jgi:hypothetical protein
MTFFALEFTGNGSSSSSDEAVGVGGVGFAASIAHAYARLLPVRDFIFYK